MILFSLALPSIALGAEPPPAKATPRAEAKGAKSTNVQLAPVGAKDFAEKVLAPRKGRVVVVSFWASYCAPCIAEMPTLLALADERKKDGVDVVLVATDPKSFVPKVNAILEKNRVDAAGVPTFLVADEDPQPFIEAVDPSWAGEVPYTLVYDRQARRAVALSGEQDRAALVSAIDKALAAR